VNRPNCGGHRQRGKARSCSINECGIDPNPRSGQPPCPLIQIRVTLTLPRPLGWLLAIITTSNLRPPDRLLEQAGQILRALIPS